MKLIRFRLLRKAMFKFRRFLFLISVLLIILITSSYFDISSNQLQNSESSIVERRGSYHPTVFFLKVHKSASSTVQNILMRYGNRYNFNFGLPFVSNYLGHPEPFAPDMVIPVSKGHSIDIICHHSRFNETNIQKVLPHDTIYVAIIRDPVYLFESIFSYYELSEHYGMTIEEFINMPTWWFNTCPRLSGRLGLNQIAFDFGVNEIDFSDDQKIYSVIEELDRIFDLVLIADYFEESVILLKHVLGLEFQDVTYLVHNERISTEKQNLTSKMIESFAKSITQIKKFTTTF
ncbi:hypothetical protein CHUAL_000742 [Chamberlinius hualienensis]